MTAHKLLYNAKEEPDGTYTFTEKSRLERNYKLIVLDEASMLPNEMWELLLSHGIHVLAMGDSGQIPPVDGNSSILDHPHIMLDEVVRQALESPIIRLSMDIRNGKKIYYGGPKECRVMSIEEVSDKLLATADQVLCGKNATRHCLNDRIRKYIWGSRHGNEPTNGDKIVCLKNQWQTLGSNMDALVNGMVGKISSIYMKDSKLYKPAMYANFTSVDGGLYNNLFMDYKIFVDKEPTVNKNNWKHYPKHTRPFEFDYAYAMTVHKYQGSQADKVVVFDEWIGNKEYHSKWLYTACTRASEKLVIVK